MPKAFPDFEDTAERFLDGELTANQEEKFLCRIKNSQDYKNILREMKFARRAVQIFKMVLPASAEFNSVRKAVLSQIR